ncbi:MAG TPA: YegS/Rv2252/BmrU family lipid kinase [Vicinamibacterales bacterium]|jgi:YegS/Rv2252/BmrU family lipid kinase
MVAFIINPVSGRRGRGTSEGERRAALARRALDQYRLDGAVSITSGRGHARELSAHAVANGADRVVAWGGDGTINEIAGPIIGSRTTLGIVPAGSGDGTACSLGLPLSTDRALDAALSASADAMDVGFLGDRHFLNIGGIGFDAAVGHAFNARRKRGGLGYLTGGLSMAWSYQCLPYQLRLDDEVWAGERFLVVFANGREYGNHVQIAPGADPRDGWLDVVAVSGGSFFQQFWRARRLVVGRDRPAEGIHRTRVRSASVSGEALICHVDGETFEAEGTVEVRISPGAIRIAGLE